MARITFIGLGVMGYPMAGHLARAGHELTVYNRSPEKAQRWLAEYTGRAESNPARAAADAEFVMTCVGNDDDLRAVTLGPDGCYESLQPGAVHVDHTTVSASIARELEEQAATRGAGFLDAPVSGGQAGAEKGALTVMIGGQEQTYLRLKPVLSAYARSERLMGPAGSGQLTKMVNQVCIAGLVQGLSEGLRFAEKAGLDGEAVVDVIRHGAAQSWQMENRYQTMLKREFDHGFAVDWMRKDLAIVMEEARNNGAPLPVTELVDSFYAKVQRAGGGRWDTSSLIALLDNEPED